MLRLALLPLVMLLFVSCSDINATKTTSIGSTTAPRSAQAAQPEIAYSDFAVTGKLLVTRNGALALWEQGNLRLIAEGQHFDGPAFSPDGMRIAASTVGVNHSDLVVLDLNGRRLLQLTDNWSKTEVQDSAWVRHPSWAPDGRRIAFASDRLGSNMSLWTIDAGGTNPQQALPAQDGGGIDWPSWAPNGKDIALTYFDSKASQLLIFDVATATTKKLTDQDGGAYDAAWSPNGAYLALTARTSGRNDIWLLSSDGNRITRVTDVGVARAPAWSPSGDVIAFLADRGDGFDLFALTPNLNAPSLVAGVEVKRLTSGQHLDAASGVSWGR